MQRLGSAAERDPRVGPGAAVEEALRAERERVGIEVGAAVHECDVRDDERAGGDREIPQREVLGREPPGDREHRAQTHRLLDDGVDVVVVAVERRRLEARELRRGGG